MDRRRFLRAAAAGAAGLWLHGCTRPGGEAAAQPCARPVAGVQLFTLRDQLQRDARAAFGALAALGIAEVELFGLGARNADVLGRPPAELRALLDAAGLAAPLTHVNDEFGDPEAAAAIAARARRLGAEIVVLALPAELAGSRDGRFTMVGAESVAQLDRLAQRLNAAGRAFRAAGVRFAYHNHHVEFRPPADAPDLVPYDYLMERTDPDAVAIELDVGWLAAAGRDPVVYLERYRGRVIACHLKDFAGAPGTDEAALQAALVEPGAGTVDFAAVLAAMAAVGVRHGFIEIDAAADPLGAVERGHRHLQALPVC